MALRRRGDRGAGAEPLTIQSTLTLHVLRGAYAVCRLDANDPLPPWATGGAFFSVTRAAAELSIVCEAQAIPSGVRSEPGWRVLMVQGPLDFGLVGIVAELARLLADAAVSIFVVSTYDTDCVLVRDRDLSRAIAALRAAGHFVTGAGDFAR